MVKHTQTIRWLLPTNCLIVFDHFVGLALKGLIIMMELFCDFFPIKDLTIFAKKYPT